jgi:hypothetical protein
MSLERDIMATPADISSPRRRGLQFTLAALLAAMTFVALLCVGLATPTRFWSETILLAVLVALLTSVLAIVYRGGRTRAFAVGFLVFTLGFLAALVCRERLFQDPRYGGGNDEFISSHLGSWLFVKIHPNNYRPSTETPGMGMGGGTFGGGMMSGGFGTPMPMMIAKYDRDRFSEIVHAACAVLAGVLGGMVAQMLYATRRERTVTDGA